MRCVNKIGFEYEIKINNSGCTIYKAILIRDDFIIYFKMSIFCNQQNYRL